MDNTTGVLQSQGKTEQLQCNMMGLKDAKA